MIPANSNPGAFRPAPGRYTTTGRKMTRSHVINAQIAGAAAAALCLSACVAFDLGPETEAARAADAAVRHYPRLVDIPEEPADAHCLRAALRQSDIQAVSADSRDALRAFEPPVPAIIPPPAQPRRPAVNWQEEFSSVVSGARTLTRMAQGEGPRPEARAPAPPLLPCPPAGLDEAQRLAEARAWLEREAESIRAERPEGASPDDISVVLPEDMGAVAAPGEGPEAAR